MLSHSLVIGYHGCDRNLAERIAAGKTELEPSQNTWDWLGHGIYFWQDSPSRALRWAETEARRLESKIKSPAVLGAVVDLGNCMNLADAEALALVKSAHQSYVELCAASGASPAENRGADLQIRRLDCAVIETLHQLRQAEGKQPFDTARGFFWKDAHCIRPPVSANWITFKSAFVRPNRSSVIFCRAEAFDNSTGLGDKPPILAHRPQTRGKIAQNEDLQDLRRYGKPSEPRNNRTTRKV